MKEVVNIPYFVNVQVLYPKGGKEGSIEITSTKLVEGHIYPNPANSVITLQRHAESAIVYSIIDIKGNVIVKMQLHMMDKSTLKHYL